MEGVDELCLETTRAAHARNGCSLGPPTQTDQEPQEPPATLYRPRGQSGHSKCPDDGPNVGQGTSVTPTSSLRCVIGCRAARVLWLG